MNTYTDRERRVVARLRKKGMTYSAIAKLTEVNPATVVSWLRPAKKTAKGKRGN